MILPDKFILKMKEILSYEFEDYLKSFEESSHCGLRINTYLNWIRSHGAIGDFIMMRI